MPGYCPRHGPFAGVVCWQCIRGKKSEELPEKIDISFTCMPAFLNFDKEKIQSNAKRNSNSYPVNSTISGSEYGNDNSYVIESQCSDKLFDANGTTRVYDPNENVENTDPNVPVENGVDDDVNDDGVDSHLADGVDEQFLTEFLDEAKDSAVYNQKMEEKRSFIKTKLDYGRRFYFESNDQLLLNHNSFLRYSGISNFDVGYAWKNKVDRMDKFQLLCQLVNEMNQIKACCLQLYYRESAISVCPSRRIKLIQKYIGKSHENEFKTKTEREVKEFVWFLKIYKRRYLNVQERVKNVLGLDVEFIKSIKTYDDVYDYFIYNCNLKEFNNNDKM